MKIAILDSNLVQAVGDTVEQAVAIYADGVSKPWSLEVPQTENAIEVYGMTVWEIPDDIAEDIHGEATDLVYEQGERVGNINIYLDAAA